MKVTLRLYLLILSFSLIIKVNAQRRYGTGFSRNEAYEVGLAIGPTIYQGDLNLSPVEFQNMRLNVGAYGRYYLGSYFAARLGFNYGKIAGDDKIAGGKYNEYDAWIEGSGGKQSQYYGRMKRNLNFYSTVWDVNAIIELHLWNPNYRPKGKLIVPYVFAGFSYFHFNPKTEDRNGKTVELVNFKTELYKSYKLYQPAIPYGLGVKINPAAPLYVSFEIGFRKTFTDWLDDVHHNYAGPGAAGNVYLQQLSDRSGEVSSDWGNLWSQTTNNPNKFIRGNPKNNDTYIICSINITKTFSSYGACTNF